MADVEAKIEREYKAGVGPKALSEKYGVSVDTIKSWIKRRKWKRGAPSDEGAPFDVTGVHPDERGNTPQKGIVMCLWVSGCVKEKEGSG